MRDKWIVIDSNGQRCMAVPSIGKYMPLRVYIPSIKTAIANPDAEFKHGLTSWDGTTGEQIRKQFRRQMHDRINQRIPYIKRK